MRRTAVVVTVVVEAEAALPAVVKTQAEEVAAAGVTPDRAAAAAAATVGQISVEAAQPVWAATAVTVAGRIQGWVRKLPAGRKNPVPAR